MNLASTNMESYGTTNSFLYYEYCCFWMKRIKKLLEILFKWQKVIMSGKEITTGMGGIVV